MQTRTVPGRPSLSPALAARKGEGNRKMLMLVSPAKRLKDTPPQTAIETTVPHYLEEARELAEAGAALPVARLKALMKLSDSLAERAHARFVHFSADEIRRGGGIPALFAFDGDVYRGIDARTLERDGLEHLVRHLGILSGLYGLLFPFDRILAYRLEMGSRLTGPWGGDLYDFWRPRLASEIARRMAAIETRTLVNLASIEYWRAVDVAALAELVPGLRIVTPEFREWRGERAKIISFFAKRARGLMVRFVAENAIDTPDGLRDFSYEGYRYDSVMSEGDRWVFTRPDSRRLDGISPLCDTVMAKHPAG
ncbi:MAG: peroxide stress protein YaaA [Alphaproteobacteria bacterium]|nr:MAG: peroxide stress protein YaaA [Alphaproteobacteria bacterium]